jgi:hypothetical protein
MLTDAIFGDSLGSAVVTKESNAAAAKCQASVQKAYEKILQAQIRSSRLQEGGLKAQTITSQAQLAACLDAIHTDAKSKISRP